MAQTTQTERVIIALCYTCSHSKSECRLLCGAPFGPRQMADPINVENHKLAGHDVRPVNRDES